MRVFERDLDRNLYEQVAEAIQEAVEDGEWGPGQALPSNYELADFFQVSVPTAARAVSDLRKKGVLTTQPGRGTFVPRQASNDLPEAGWMKEIDLTTPRPAYLQVADTICEAIISGALKIGEPLPVRLEMCKLFNVSHMVIQNAVRELRGQGVLSTMSGRGVFVKAKPTSRPGEVANPVTEPASETLAEEVADLRARVEALEELLTRP